MNAIDPDHPKFEAFQKAIRDALEKRLRDADEELARLKKENADKEKVREDETSRLHQTQKFLKHEQRKLRQVEQDLMRVSTERQRLEEKNKRENGRIVEMVRDVLEARARFEELQRDHNRVLMHQIYLTSRRVKAAGDVNACHTSASKCEEEFQKLNEQKSAQDLYLDKLSQDLEDLEQKCLDYEAQTDAMRKQSSEIEDLVRKAERESDKIRQEKMAIMQRWTLAVINISKRDEALVNFRSALKSQELKLKGIKAEIDGAKNEIIALQEKHGHLTSIQKRTERLCAQRKAQIKKTDEFIEEAKSQLLKANETLEKTSETLNSTDADLKAVTRDVAEARTRIEKFVGLRRQLDDELFLLSQEQLTSDKSAQNAQKAIVLVREKTKVLENRLIEAQNQLSSTMQEIMERTATIEQQTEQQRDMESKLTGLQKELEVLDSAIVRAQAEVDKKQHVIDRRLEEKVTLIESGKSVSPLEAELQRLKEEIEAVTLFCNEAKQMWLKYQNEYIVLLEERSNARSSLTDLSRKEVIMQEKNSKLQREISALDHNVNVEVKRKIESLHGSILRLQRLQAEEKENYNTSLKSIESRRAQEVNKMQHVLDEVEAVKIQVQQLNLDIEKEKREATTAADLLSEWEEKVKTCKKTQSIISQERDPEGELAHLRNEVHRMQMRSEQVDRATKVLIASMENYVGRREGLVDKASAINLVRADRFNKTQMTKSLISKKVEDLKNRLRKLCKEEREFLSQLEELENRDREQQFVLESRHREIGNWRDQISDIREQMEHHLNAKERTLNLILELQTRAKWYRSINEKKYRLTLKDSEETAKTEIIMLQTQNKNMKEILRILQDEFPALRRNIRKAGSGLND